MGVQIASITTSQSGFLSNFGAAAKEVTPDKIRLASTSDVQLYFASGNQWGNWQPKGIILSQPAAANLPHTTPAHCASPASLFVGSVAGRLRPSDLAALAATPGGRSVLHVAQVAPSR